MPVLHGNLRMIQEIIYIYLKMGLGRSPLRAQGRCSVLKLNKKEYNI